MNSIDKAWEDCERIAKEIRADKALQTWWDALPTEKRGEVCRIAKVLVTWAFYSFEYLQEKEIIVLSLIACVFDKHHRELYNARTFVAGLDNCPATGDDAKTLEYWHSYCREFGYDPITCKALPDSADAAEQYDLDQLAKDHDPSS